ncbi:unnamed protein product [Schistocephalus solidus]|uniref:Uncharacterized protein n=1 Tax=Schistocephalus solidus TaxID=70667 RepID=A0A3P7CKH3_SCHSO|nr:unnamed protein product [Schistocephalus solidus]
MIKPHVVNIPANIQTRPDDKPAREYSGTNGSFGEVIRCLKSLRILRILGLTAFIWGIVARTTGSFGPLDQHLPAVNSGANLLITVGFFIMLVATLGCCGAIRESQCMLMSFFFSIFMCFTLLMAAGLWAVAWQPRLSVHLFSSLEKLFACCGVTGAVDFVPKKAPASCGVTTKEISQRPGCHSKILQAGQDNLSTIAGIGMGFAMIMVGFAGATFPMDISFCGDCCKRVYFS